MLSVIDELCVRRFQFILLIILPDKGLVEVMDPKRNDLETWADMDEMLKR